MMSDVWNTNLYYQFYMFSWLNCNLPNERSNYNNKISETTEKSEKLTKKSLLIFHPWHSNQLINDVGISMKKMVAN